MNQYTIKQIADALKITPSSVKRRAKKGDWPFTEESVRGGKRRLYALDDLPTAIQTALLIAYEPAVKDDSNDDFPALKCPRRKTFEYDAEALWNWADSRTAKMRERGRYIADLMRQLTRVMNSGKKFTEAAYIVGLSSGEKEGNLRSWYYGSNGKPGAKHYRIEDWDAAMVPRFVGRVSKATCDEEAWDWYKGHYLNRRQPTHAETYRRLKEIAADRGWKIPCGNTHHN